MAVDLVPAAGGAGESFGLAEPSTLRTGLEKVRRSGVAGETSEPGAGLAATLGEPPAGNQVTLCGLPGRSQERGTAATMTVPAACLGAEADRAARVREGAVAAGDPGLRR